ncbi:MAG: ferritin [Fibrobacterota bacterium]
MISNTMSNAINEQINKELYSEYYYLSMASYFNAVGLDGFENFFLVQVEEERFHAMKMYSFLSERGGRIVLGDIKMEGNDFDSPVAVFEAALKHEEFVTASINKLMDTAIAEKDHAAASFLNWFVDEQVEEEATFGTLLDKLKLINGEGHGMLMMNDELSKRTFTPPAQ